MGSKFAAALAERDGQSKFETALKERDEGFNPVAAVGRFIGDAAESISGAIKGQNDPAFEGVPGFTGAGLRDPESASAVNRAKVLGVSDDVYGKLVKEALGTRLQGVEKDKFGQEVITYTDDTGQQRREFINSPGLDVQDVDRLLSSSLPFVAAGGAVGAATKAAPLAVRAGAQVLGQAGASVGQDVAADTDIDIPKAGIAGLGGGLGETFMPLVRGVVGLFKKDPGLISSQTGKLTPQGVEALERAGINQQDITPEFLTQLARPDISRSADDIQSVMRAQADQFGIRSSQGQRSLDPNALSIEEQSRRGLLGQSAKDVATDFDTGQRADVVRAVDDLSPGTARTPGDAGGELQAGLIARSDAADQSISEAFDAVDINNVFPKGIPKSAFDDLGERVRTELGTTTFDSNLTPTAVEAVRLLDDFSKGKVRQPKIDLLKKGAAPKSNFDSVRRAINQRVGNATDPADVRATALVKKAYNEWVSSLANGALETGNPVEFAKLQSAIGLTAELKGLFKVRGSQDAGGKILKKIMNDADSPEGAIATMLTGSFESAPKNGSVNAAQRMKVILEKKQPEAWHAMRQAYWLKLTRGKNLFKEGPVTRGELDTALGQITRNIEGAMTNQKSLVNVLFAPREVTQIRNFGRAARRSQSLNPNPSGTAFEAQRMNAAAKDSILPNLLKRQAAGQQIRGNAVRATFWRIMTKRAVSILGARGEGVAARGAGRTFSQELPKRRTTGGGGIGGATAVQLEDRNQ